MYIYGKNVVREVLNGNTKILKAFINKDSKDFDIIDELKKTCEVKITDKKELDQLTDYALHQGIVLKVADYEYCDVDEILDGLILILDHLEDPHNFGAIIRTAEAAGIKGIIIPKDRSVEVNGTVMKTSVGTLEKVKIARVTNLINTIDYLKKKAYWIVGTDMTGQNYDQLDYKGNIALVIGNEGSGISRLVRENCDFIASIPMDGTVNSLNASVAAAIIIFEATKQRR